jgi:hypothetical protein
MGDSPFFGYTAKRGYRNARRTQHTTGIIDFVQNLNLSNTSVAQVIARIWHNARPRKVGTLTWLILNNGLPVGTWRFKSWVFRPLAKGATKDFWSPLNTA